MIILIACGLSLNHYLNFINYEIILKYHLCEFRKAVLRMDCRVPASNRAGLMADGIPVFLRSLRMARFRLRRSRADTKCTRMTKPVVRSTTIARRATGVGPCPERVLSRLKKAPRTRQVHVICDCCALAGQCCVYFEVWWSRGWQASLPVLWCFKGGVKSTNEGAWWSQGPIQEIIFLYLQLHLFLFPASSVLGGQNIYSGGRAQVGPALPRPWQKLSVVPVHGLHLFNSSE